MSPKEIAPNIFKCARFKKTSAYTEINNNNWIRNLNNINSTSLIEEFILLFMALTEVNLSNDRDEIIWKWASNGKYSVSSIYDCQFRGSIIHFSATSIWQETTEPKCRFFGWLVLHDRVLTANNMIKRNWPCNYNCFLCLCMHESTEHILTQCNYTEAAWNVIATRFGLPNYNHLSVQGGPNQWVNAILSVGSKKEKKKETWNSILLLVDDLERV
jgi:hypothetical protein